MIFLYIIAGIVVLLLILAMIAPKKFEVSRDIEINCSKSKAFEYLKYVKNQDEWSPWKKKDPDMKQEFVGTDGEVGFISKWVGNKEVGEGEQEIKEIIEGSQLNTELRFFKPWKSQSDAYIKVEDIGEERCRVIWGFKGKNKIPFNIMMLFMNMDKAVGKDFEEGLQSLKEILER